jgi:hypothetical protein
VVERDCINPKYYFVTIDHKFSLTSELIERNKYQAKVNINQLRLYRQHRMNNALKITQKSKKLKKYPSLT